MAINFRKFIFYISLAMLSLCSFSAFAENKISKIAVVTKNNQTQLQFDLSSQVKYRVYTTSKPKRLVVEFDESKLKFDLKSFSNPLFLSVKQGVNNQGQLQIIFNLAQDVKVAKSVITKNGGRYSLNAHLTTKNTVVSVIDNKSTLTENVLPELGKTSEKLPEKLSKKESEIDDPLGDDPLGKFIDEKIIDKPQNIVAATSNAIATAPITKAAHEVVKSKRIPVIIIDAGHGGKDSGTIGRFAKSKEKYVTLGYARELKRQLDAKKKFKVYLTRDKDVFIPLGERVARARRVKADLFISVHADASPDRDTSGLSIYTLSETSSDKQAEALAQKENKSDIIGGADFSDASGDILKTLITMSQRSTMNDSAKFAESAIKSIRKNNVVTLQRTHRFAGFRVLTAPDIPSVLIELGYLSNKDEEKQLNNLHYKKKVIESIVESIEDYFGTSSGMIPLSQSKSQNQKSN